MQSLSITSDFWLLFLTGFYSIVDFILIQTFALFPAKQAFVYVAMMPREKAFSFTELESKLEHCVSELSIQT